MSWSATAVGRTCDVRRRISTDVYTLAHAADETRTCVPARDPTNNNHCQLVVVADVLVVLQRQITQLDHCQLVVVADIVVVLQQQITQKMKPNSTSSSSSSSSSAVAAAKPTSSTFVIGFMKGGTVPLFKARHNQRDSKTYQAL